MSNATPKLIRGIILQDTVDFVQAKSGAEGVTKLEQACGESIIDPHRFYPLETLTKYQNESLKIVFGHEDDEGHYALGQHAFQAFAHTIVGASLTNVPTPKELIEKIQQLWSTVVNFGQRNIEVMDEEKRQATILIEHDPRRPAYLRGVIESGLKLIPGTTPQVQVDDQKPDAYRLTIHW